MMKGIKLKGKLFVIPNLDREMTFLSLPIFTPIWQMLSLLHYHVFIGTAKLVLSYVFVGFVSCFSVSAFLQLNCLISKVIATQSAAEITKFAHENCIRQNKKIKEHCILISQLEVKKTLRNLRKI